MFSIDGSIEFIVRFSMPMLIYFNASDIKLILAMLFYLTISLNQIFLVVFTIR